MYRELNGCTDGCNEAVVHLKGAILLDPGGWTTLVDPRGHSVVGSKEGGGGAWLFIKSRKRSHNSPKSLIYHITINQDYIQLIRFLRNC